MNIQMKVYSITEYAYSNGSTKVELIPLPRELGRPWNPDEFAITGNIAIQYTGRDGAPHLVLGGVYDIALTLQVREP